MEENTTDPIKDNSEQPLILGRFKSQSDLEKSYQELETSYSQKKNFESQYEDANSKLNSYVVPEEYKATGDLIKVSENDLRNLAIRAKKLSLTQSQFETYASDKVKRKADLEEQQLKDKVEVDEVLKSYMTEDLGLSDNLVSKMSKDDLNVFSKQRSSTLDTDTSIHGGYSQNSNITKREAYKTMNALKRRGGKEYDNAFNVWKSLVE